MSIPPNQFRRDHPWTRFVLLDSSAGPVPSQAKVTHSLTLSSKKKKRPLRPYAALPISCKVYNFLNTISSLNNFQIYLHVFVYTVFALYIFACIYLHVFALLYKYLYNFRKARVQKILSTSKKLLSFNSLNHLIVRNVYISLRNSK